MRIIGGKDYYDHGLAFGQDDSVVFLRTGRDVFSRDWAEHGFRPTGGMPALQPAEHGGGTKFNVNPWRASPVCWRYERREYSAASVFAVFCGKFYSGVKVKWSPDWDGRGLKPGETTSQYYGEETFWDADSYAKWVGARGMIIKPTSKKKSGSQDSEDPRLLPFARYALEGAALDLMLREGVATATMDRRRVERVSRRGDSLRSDDTHVWECNHDTLKNYQFVKVMDPVQAFQELSMWIGGVLPKPGNPTVQITDDKVKLAKHGMDESSFRTPPGKKRGK